MSAIFNVSPKAHEKHKRLGQKHVGLSLDCHHL